MKTITLKNAVIKDASQYPDGTYPELKIEVEDASDGYHTFDKLYEQRFALFVKLAYIFYRDESHDVWRSKLHGDGSMRDGWYVMGIDKKAGEQITYHFPISMWPETNFAETLEKAPEFDGHTSEDVLNRISNL